MIGRWDRVGDKELNGALERTMIVQRLEGLITVERHGGEEDGACVLCSEEVSCQELSESRGRDSGQTSSSSWRVL